MSKIAWVIGLVALLGMGLWARRQATRADQLSHNLRATQDSSRIIKTEYGDAATRLALIVQDVNKELSTLKDSLARANRRAVRDRGITSAASVQLGIALRGDSGVKTQVADSTDTLRVTGPPVSATVSVVVRPKQFEWAYAFQAHPVPVRVTVGCGKTGPEVVATTSDWATIDVGRPITDDKLCKKNRSTFTTLLLLAGAFTTGMITWEAIR